MLTEHARTAADQLNRECFCVTLDQNALASAQQTEVGDADFFATLTQTRPHLFSHAPVFLPKADSDGMQAIVNAVGNYIAQAIAPPSERTIKLDGERVQRNVDVRLYTYDGDILLAAARLYQGQTTNFRTPGGGFAPVFFV